MSSRSRYFPLFMRRALAMIALVAIVFVVGCENKQVAATFSSASSADFTVGVAGSFTVLVTGSPAPMLSESGTLPAGVTFNASSGVLAGTPGAGSAGTYIITFTAVNSFTPATQSFTLIVVAPPVISSFTAAASTIGAGSSTTLTAVFSGGSGSVNNSVGTVSSGTAVTVTPSATTTYMLTVANAAGASVTTTAIVTVVPAPSISSFIAAKTTITAGTSTTLTGVFVGIGSVNNGVGAVTSGTGVNITPASTATYVLTVTNALGATSVTATVTVTVVPAPVITSFVAGATSITAGNNTTLTAIFSAGSGSVNNGVGAVKSSTAANITPASTTTYTLTVINAAGTSVTAQVTVTVVPAPVIASFRAGAATITSGTSTTLTATFSGGTGSVNNGVGAVTSGTPVNITPSTTTTYTLTVTNSLGASITAQATVTVVPPPVITSFKAGSSTITVGNSTTLTATFSGGTGSVNNGVGAVTSGTPVNITPSTTTTYTLTVTNAANNSTTAQVTVTVNTPPHITSATSATFSVGRLSSFTVTTTGAPTPTLSETRALPRGVTFQANGNGTATLSGTSASGTNGTYNITITAQNGITPNATQSFTLTVNTAPMITSTSGSFTVTTSVITDPCAGAGTGSESLLNGQYAFLLKGFDNGMSSGETQPEPAIVGGVLNFNGSGSITTGTLDQNLNSTGGVLSLSVTSGTYEVGSDRRACMAITTSQGTQHYRASLGNISGPGVAATGHMIDFDTTGPFTTGVLKLQTSTAFSTSQVTGNYAFEIASPQNTTSSAGGIQALAGVMYLNDGTISGGEFDLNDEGTLEGDSTLTSWPASAGFAINSGGTYSIDPSSGRGTLTFSVNVNGGTINPADVIYVVSSSDFLILTNFNQTQTGGIFGGGEALQQSGKFSAASLNGTSVIYLSSLSLNCPTCNPPNPPTSNTTIGVITANGSGTFTAGTIWEIIGGNLENDSLSGTTYSAEATGRVLVTSGSHPPVFYMVSDNEAFIMDGSASVQTGMAEPQTSTSAPSGTYAFGTIDPQDSNVGANSGAATFSGGSVSVTSDNNSNGNFSAGQTFGPLYVYVDSTGLGSISPNTSACTIGSSLSPCQLIFYSISGNSAVLMDLTNDAGQPSSNPSLQIADQ